MGTLLALKADSIPEVVGKREAFLYVPVATMAFAHGGYAVFPVPEWTKESYVDGVFVAAAAAHGNWVHEKVPAEPDVPAMKPGPKATVGVMPAGEYLHSREKHLAVLGCLDVDDPEHVKSPGEKTCVKTVVVEDTEKSHGADAICT